MRFRFTLLVSLYTTIYYSRTLYIIITLQVKYSMVERRIYIFLSIILSNIIKYHGFEFTLVKFETLEPFLFFFIQSLIRTKKSSFLQIHHFDKSF